MTDTKHEPRKPNPIDVHVGAKIRLRRQVLQMSQEKLGSSLGVSFQQQQKYERGANRVSASRLFEMSKALDVPVGFFFDGLEGQGTQIQDEGDTATVYSFINSVDGVGFASALSRIKSGSTRRKLLELTRAIAGEESEG